MESTLIAGWSELPNDILEHLTSFFSLSDYLRFGAVCRNWFSVAKQRHHMPRQLPWLVMGEDDTTHKRMFFSIEENKHYFIDIPKLCGQLLCGSSYGWLFTLDIKLKFRLFNPFTKKYYDLPPLPPFSEHLENTRYVKAHNDYLFERMPFLFVSKAILDRDPSCCSDFKVLIIYGGRLKLAYWSHGDSAWTLIQGGHGTINDILFFKEKFYVVRASYQYNEIYVVNAKSATKILRVGPKVPFIDSKIYLVDYMGQLLLIERRRKIFDRWCLIPHKIIVTKIDIEDQKYYVYKPRDGHAVFIGANSSMTVDPSKYPRCKKNALYLTDMATQYFPKEFKCNDLWIYDMAQCSFSRYYCSKSYISYLVFPIWLIPNFQ